MANLSEIISPITLENFFEQYWRKEPLYIANQEHFDWIISPDDINEFFNNSVAAYPLLRLHGDGKDINSEEFLIPGGFANLINKAKLFEYFEKGQTIIINGCHYQFPKVRDMVSDLRAELGMNVQANLYITPSTAQGFYPHYDTHEVIVVQIAGSKCWNIYDTPVLAPIPGFTMEQNDRNIYKETEPLHRIKLEKGDVLYIPRGVVHDAYCEEEMSIHLTIGITPLLRTQILKKLMPLAEKDPYFRENFFTGKQSDLTENERTEFISKTVELVQQVLLNQNVNYSDSELTGVQNLFADHYMIESIDSIDDFSRISFMKSKNSELKNLTELESKILKWTSNYDHALLKEIDLSMSEIKNHLKSLVRRDYLVIE